ncbi:(2Fe-2S)-binding protein [Paraburkholderia bryophila]|uniref:(2Fe-2S)-binding protein n=1 Tax=Paraburkholderia bryophila TaxID=420952 RepID=UPI00234BCA50|nr:(2Fe-2S)-binding protein [Paraburkholderia bryophila]WCM20032.1 (2Fe-2S)-binding protein [Paraburkholderia bryophila]
MTISISLTVNGAAISASIDPGTLLVQFLREQLRLTGTHVGCDTAQCGACTVHLNGRAIKSCNILAVQADGATVTTIEGLAENGALHPMQAAFKHCHGLQCGFCTPGMVMSAVSLVERQPDLTGDDVRAQLDGNLCRCTGYHNIVKAVIEGAAGMKSAGSANAAANTAANAAAGSATANSAATAPATA